jgi:PhnB protein
VSEKVPFMPPPFRSVTPHIIVKDSAAAIDFYQKAFGAVERFRIPNPDGKGLMHAEIMIGDSIVMLGEEMAEVGYHSPASLNGSSVTLMLYVEDTDAAYKQACAAGAQNAMQPQDMFWGDRYGQVIDPFGHRWAIATHLRDPSPEEITAGAAAFGKDC